MIYLAFMPVLAIAFFPVHIAVALFEGIDWRTVGHYVKAAHGRIEPDVIVRIPTLLRTRAIETFCRKSFSYITVVCDMERNTEPKPTHNGVMDGQKLPEIQADCPCRQAGNAGGTFVQYRIKRGSRAKC